MSERDLSGDLCERIEAACAQATPLCVRAGNSKSSLGCRFDGEELDVAGHSGIVEYEPDELVLTARAGTPLQHIEETLNAANQMLGFEPPRPNAAASLGGTLACNLSGPARPWLGSVRDAVLGIRLINGRGQHMRFGGRVIKNVAGFDVSRLQAGAFGALGVITEISLKVLPQPEASATLVLDVDARTAIARMNELAGSTAPLTGAAWMDGLMYLRLAGARTAVHAAGKSIGGDRTDDEFWTLLRDQKLDIFVAQDARPLWRMAVRSTADVLLDEETLLIDWGGAQRFVRRDADLTAMSGIAQRAGGHAMRMTRGGSNQEFLQPPQPGIRALHQRLKQAFDPARILNRGRLYGWL